jgi:predicted phosphohydrolase
MIGDKHQMACVRTKKVVIVIYEKFGVQNWEKTQFQWREIKLNEKGEKIQKREKILKKLKLEKKLKSWKKFEKIGCFH